MKRSRKYIIQRLQQIADKLKKGYRKSAILERIVKIKTK